MERSPIQVESEMLRKVYTQVGFACHAVKGVFELFLMDIDRHVCAAEIFKAASVVEMEMSHDDRRHVGNFMASLCNLRLEFLVRVVVGLGENVVQRSPPILRIVFTSPCLKQYQPFSWMFDES